MPPENPVTEGEEPTQVDPGTTEETNDLHAQGASDEASGPPTEGVVGDGEENEADAEWRRRNDGLLSALRAERESKAALARRVEDLLARQHASDSELEHYKNNVRPALDSFLQDYAEKEAGLRQAQRDAALLRKALERAQSGEMVSMEDISSEFDMQNMRERLEALDPNRLTAQIANSVLAQFDQREAARRAQAEAAERAEREKKLARDFDSEFDSLVQRRPDLAPLREAYLKLHLMTNGEQSPKKVLGKVLKVESDRKREEGVAATAQLNDRTVRAPSNARRPADTSKAPPGPPRGEIRYMGVEGFMRWQKEQRGGGRAR